MNTAATGNAGIYRRFGDLGPGAKADLRRAATPDQLRDTPGLYRLFPGHRPTPDQVNAAFLIAWCEREVGGTKIAPACAEKVAEARIIQIARAPYPEDLIAFRRVVIQLQPQLGWQEIAPLAWDWNQETKRELVEAYYIVIHKLGGANA